MSNCKKLLSTDSIHLSLPSARPTHHLDRLLSCLGGVRLLLLLPFWICHDCLQLRLLPISLIFTSLSHSFCLFLPPSLFLSSPSLFFPLFQLTLFCCCCGVDKRASFYSAITVDFIPGYIIYIFGSL